MIVKREGMATGKEGSVEENSTAEEIEVLGLIETPPPTDHSWLSVGPCIPKI